MIILVTAFMVGRDESDTDSDFVYPETIKTNFGASYTYIYTVKAV